MDNKDNQNNPVPHIPVTEMKMPVQTQVVEEKPSLNKSILVILVILLLLILAGLYIWSTTIMKEVPPVTDNYTRPTAEENNEPEAPTAEAEVETIQAVSTSDELGLIESDLEATNLDSIEVEFTDIEAELDASAQ